jgi:hypothetical protein
VKNVIVVMCRELLRQRPEIILLLALTIAHIFMSLLFGIHWKYHRIVLRSVSLL